MLSVSELNEQAKTLLETTFSYVEGEGEISRLVRHGSGHWYFTLKDEKASYAPAARASSNLRLNNLKPDLRAKGFLISRAKNRYLNFLARSR